MKRHFVATRGIAILFVIINHSIYMGMTYSDQWGFSGPVGFLRVILVGISQLGIFSVPIFLFISGCISNYALSGLNQKYPLRFLVNSIKNILFPYLIWSLLFYLLLYSFEGTSFSLFGYIKNLIVGYPFNFVPIWIFWYIVSPLIGRLTSRQNIIFLIIVGIIQFIMLNLQNPGIYGFYFPDWMSWVEPKIISTQLALWGIYFPLGLFFSKNIEGVSRFIYKIRFSLIILSISLFTLTILDTLSVINIKWINYVCPLFSMPLILIVNKNKIPMFSFFEKLGKKSYGFYLSNLIVLYISLVFMKVVMSWAFGLPVGLYLLLFIIALGIPWLLMESLLLVGRNTTFKIVFGYG